MPGSATLGRPGSDNAATWLGGNVLIASGGITLLALFVIELRIVALLT